MKHLYPFTALVGQEKLKRALLINLVNPLAGGVLISGEKGTGKSTLVRSLARLMEDKTLVDLPLNVTEDRLVGSIDMERALLEGRAEISDSLLSQAHGNILYLDEVNLLSDNIVNILLEVSQSHICQVEREGISSQYPSDFILIASMNPEEGELRGQFLDRFGLYVEVEGSQDLDERQKIIRSRLSYEEDKEAFAHSYRQQEEDLRQEIREARERLGQVRPDEASYEMAARFALDAYVSGHRADIYIIEAAKALAALDGRTYLSLADIKEAAEYVLAHRARELPELGQEEEEQEEQEEQEQEEEQEEGQDNPQEDQGDSPGEAQEDRQEPGEEDSQEDQEEENQEEDRESPQEEEKREEEDQDRLDKIGASYRVRNMEIKPLDRKKRRGSGRRSLVRTDRKQGRYVRSIASDRAMEDLAFDATLRAAAPFQKHRDKQGRAIAIEKSDLHRKVREKRTGTSILFVVDASGSMGAEERMEAVKGAIMSLLTDAYEKRDSVGMLSFRRNEAQLILGMTRSVDLAHKKLEDLPTGGKTPLSLGLNKAYEVLRGARKKDPDIIPVMVLVSDGRSNVAYRTDDHHKEVLEEASRIKNEGIQSIVIDTEQGFIKLGLAKEISRQLEASYYRLEDLRSDEIVGYLKNNIK